jgi:hypothetical protein
MKREYRVLLFLFGACLCLCNPHTLRDAFLLAGGSLIVATLTAWWFCRN